MAYFSNGTEGMAYEEKWCCRCIHRGHEDGPGCRIWLAHLGHNYKQLEDDQQELRRVLTMLIPEKDGKPDKCSMFVEGVKVHSGPISEHYKAWADKQGLVEVNAEQFKTLP